MEKVQFINTKKITSELMDVLGKYDLTVADAIMMLEMTKNKILTTTKIKANSVLSKNISKDLSSHIPWPKS